MTKPITTTTFLDGWMQIENDEGGYLIQPMPEQDRKRIATVLIAALQ